jgi:hypothetical protein
MPRHQRLWQHDVPLIAADPQDQLVGHLAQIDALLDHEGQFELEAIAAVLLDQPVGLLREKPLQRVALAVDFGGQGREPLGAEDFPLNRFTGKTGTG